MLRWNGYSNHQESTKNIGIVNGAVGHVRHIDRDIVVVQLSNGALVPIHRLRYECEKVYTAFPLEAAYCTTVAKAQGRTLGRIGVHLDCKAPGAGYVVCSRVRRLNDLFWLSLPEPGYFVPLAT